MAELCVIASKCLWKAINPTPLIWPNLAARLFGKKASRRAGERRDRQANSNKSSFGAPLCQSRGTKSRGRHEIGAYLARRLGPKAAQIQLVGFGGGGDKVGPDKQKAAWRLRWLDWRAPLTRQCNQLRLREQATEQVAGANTWAELFRPTWPSGKQYAPGMRPARRLRTWDWRRPPAWGSKMAAYWRRFVGEA